MLRMERLEGPTGGLRPRALATVVALLGVTLLLAGCAGPLAAAPVSTPVGKAVAASASPTAQPFDPSVGAPLPSHRIVAAYGIVGGVEFNGPASTLDLLASYQSEMNQLAQQYAALDPTHPVLQALDLVVNVIQPCGSFPQWCSSWPDDATIQAYVQYCQQHNLLLFFDTQLGTEPVSDAVMNHLLPYLTKYSFTELALDTEFHFPNNPQGYAEARGYPCCLGWMDATEINWAINELAQISVQNHLPRKVLVVHQWDPSVIHNKDQVKRDPNVSVVLQSDGWGGTDNKLGDYQVFVQQHLLEYGGYKLFLPHNGDPQVDSPLQSPQAVMQLFPQPLFVSYQ